MPFTVKDWRDTIVGDLAQRPTAASAGAGVYFYARDTDEAFLSDGTDWSSVNTSELTLLNAAAVEDMETRLSDYTDVTPPRGVWLPQHNDYRYWTFDPLFIGQSTHSSISAGFMLLSAVLVPVAQQITSVDYYVTIAGATLTNCYIAAYDSAGNRLGMTADQSTAWTSTGAKRTAFASAFTPPSSGPDAFIWVGHLAGSYTGAPSFAAPVQAPLVYNFGLSAAGGRYGYQGGGYTSPPASITPGNMVIGATQKPAWFGLL